ncbi:MAG: DNA methyltransferase [Candidatus Micrarchaeota archaeon]
MISYIRELGRYFTFESDKSKPIYNWFYYKEAYSSEFVEQILDKFGMRNGNILDPFCGIGTTCLVAKSRGLHAFGVDCSQLAVFIGKVKTRNYSESDISIIYEFMKNIFQEKTSAKLNWKFELFKIENAFPPANLRDILFIRQKISEIDNEKARDFALLALISIIPMCSFILKDGGVLKIVKKSVAPVKEMFKRKIKRMLADIRSENRITGSEPQIYLGDARLLPFESEIMDAIITSPPYLNNIDYTKVYGLELSLLQLCNDFGALDLKKTRKRSIRSFIASNIISNADEFRDELEIQYEIQSIGYKIPIIRAYFSDMEKVLKESFRVLKHNGTASFVVGNSVIHGTHVFVDEIIAEIGARIGFESEIWIGSERIANIGTAKIKTRESAVILRKF